MPDFIPQLPDSVLLVIPMALLIRAAILQARTLRDPTGQPRALDTLDRPPDWEGLRHDADPTPPHLRPFDWAHRVPGRELGYPSLGIENIGHPHDFQREIYEGGERRILPFGVRHG